LKRSSQKAKAAASPEKKQAVPRPPLSPGRKRLFRGIALSLPFLALALVEVVCAWRASQSLSCGKDDLVLGKF
jgi:hypothetical protein